MAFMSGRTFVIVALLLQASLVPFANDVRFPDDTLFLVFEDDYRFERPTEEFENEEDREASRRVLPAFGPGEVPVPPVPEPEQRRKIGPTLENARRMPAQVWREGGVSEYLQDLVRTAILAHRVKRGNFVWCGWVPAAPGSNKKTGRSALAFGSHCILVSKEGFKHLQHDFGPGNHEALRTPGHIDLCLKRWCVEAHLRARCCYVVPAVGNYTRHISGCSHEYLSVPRPNGWDDPWTRQGTRKSHDLQKRDVYLCCWTKKGMTEWLNEIKPEEDHVVWRTCRAGDVDMAVGAATVVEPAACDGGGQSAAAAKPAEADTKRSRRLKRDVNTRDKFRNWVTSAEEAPYRSCVNATTK